MASLIKFRCLSCNSLMKASAADAGKEMICRACGDPEIVPSPLAPFDPEPPLPQSPFWTNVENGLANWKSRANEDDPPAPVIPVNPTPVRVTRSYDRNAFIFALAVFALIAITLLSALIEGLSVPDANAKPRRGRRGGGRAR